MSYIGNQPIIAAYITDSFSGTGSQVAFSLSVAPAGGASIFVIISGVVQDPTTYGVSGNTLTFSTAPPTGTGNISIRYLGVPATGVVTTAYRTVTEFTATAGQTTFTPPGYTAGFINVYRNGVRLGSADYTATNGITVVLTTGATLNDLITTESFYVSSVLNAIPATAGSIGASYLASGSVTQAKLGTNVAGTGPAFSAYPSGSTQSVTNATFTKVTLDTEIFDTNSNFASSTFTPTVAGYYQINACIAFGTSAILNCVVQLYKNGSALKRGAQMSIGSGGFGEVHLSMSATVYMNGSTDYLELYGYVNGTTPLFYGGSQNTYFEGSLIRAA